MPNILTLNDVLDPDAAARLQQRGGVLLVRNPELRQCIANLGYAPSCCVNVHATATPDVYEEKILIISSMEFHSLQDLSQAYRIVSIQTVKPATPPTTEIDWLPYIIGVKVFAVLNFEQILGVIDEYGPGAV